MRFPSLEVQIHAVSLAAGAQVGMLYVRLFGGTCEVCCILAIHVYTEHALPKQCGSCTSDACDMACVTA